MHVFSSAELDRGELPSFPFTNDWGLQDRYTELGLFNEQIPSASHDAAVIVGTGAVSSMADVLPEEILITDKEVDLLAWVAHGVKAIRQYDTPEEFIDQVRPPAFPLTCERSILGQVHFLASEERYQQVRQVLSRKSFTYVQMNYARSEEIKELGDLLVEQGKMIRVFNATNMHRHIMKRYQADGSMSMSDYVKSLQQLPWADDYRILASTPQLTADTQSLPAFESLGQYANVAMNQRRMSFAEARAAIYRRRAIRAHAAIRS